MKRFIYLAYYFNRMDWPLLHRYFSYVAKKESTNRFVLWVQMVVHSLRYNISLLEYFQFGFYHKDRKDKLKWAGTGFMYEYQQRMNPRKSRHILENKIHFLNHYHSFVNRNFASLDSLKDDSRPIAPLLNNASGKIVLKKSNGQVGRQVEVVPTEALNRELLIGKMEEKGYDLVEEYIVQHPRLMELSPAGVNTLRIITQVNQQNVVQYLGARLRISVNSAVDNLGAGNLAAPVNLKTGLVNAPAVYSDITMQEVEYHPVTGIRIVGFQIPFWKDVLSLAESLAMLYPQNRSVGWDIAITAGGPEIIEGNHNWCKLLWQLPVKKGLKPVLEQQLSSSML